MLLQKLKILYSREGTIQKFGNLMLVFLIEYKIAYLFPVCKSVLSFDELI